MLEGGHFINGFLVTLSDICNHKEITSIIDMYYSVAMAYRGNYFSVTLQNISMRSVEVEKFVNRR